MHTHTPGCTFYTSIHVCVRAWSECSCQYSKLAVHSSQLYVNMWGSGGGEENNTDQHTSSSSLDHLLNISASFIRCIISCKQREHNTITLLLQYFRGRAVKRKASPSLPAWLACGSPSPDVSFLPFPAQARVGTQT